MSVRCLISDELQLIVITLPKNASSTLKHVFRGTPVFAEETSYQQIDKRAKEQYLKIAILRDPVTRFLSAYQEISMRIEKGTIDKGNKNFVDMEDTPARIESFLDSIRNRQWDVHIQKQVDLLRGMEVDLYGSVEWLQQDIEQLYQRFNLGVCSRLPTLRTRLERGKQYGYTKFTWTEPQLDRSLVAKVEEFYRDDLDLYHDKVISECIGSGRFLQSFQSVNVRKKHCFVYHLGNRGFTAELTTVARAMAFSIATERRLLLSCEQFTGSYKLGWKDYFLEFCEEYDEAMEKPSTIHCYSNQRGPGTHFDLLKEFQPEVLAFGQVVIRRFQNILGVFSRAIFRTGAQVALATRQAREKLKLPESFAAVHIRRGDKIGDEDVYYSFPVYWNRLKKQGFSSEPLLVLSDDMRAVEEVQQWFSTNGFTNPVLTLCDKNKSGFSIDAYRNGENFYTHRQSHNTDNSSNLSEQSYQELVQLLAEISIASESRIFVGTFYSNVSRLIWFLQGSPHGAMLFPGDAREP